MSHELSRRQLWHFKSCPSPALPLPPHHPTPLSSGEVVYRATFAFIFHITVLWTGNFKDQHLFIDATPGMSRPNVDTQFTAWTIMDLTLGCRQHRKVASKRWMWAKWNEQIASSISPNSAAHCKWPHFRESTSSEPGRDDIKFSKLSDQSSIGSVNTSAAWILSSKQAAVGWDLRDFYPSADHESKAALRGTREGESKQRGWAWV